MDHISPARKRYILFIFFFWATILYAQKKAPAPPSGADCIQKRFQFSESERLKHYPFNVAKNIIIVSFDQVNDSIGLRLPLKMGVLDTVHLKEKFKLNRSQLDQLTDILFNYDLKKPRTIATATECFEPHHAIVFTDGQGKVMEFVEICFFCNNLEKSSGKVVVGTFCDEKYKLLKALFKQIGITAFLHSPGK